MKTKTENKTKSNHKLTKQERRWVLYDVGDKAFILLATTIIPLYFDRIAESNGLSSVNYLAYWGYATSITTLLVILAAPILSTIADGKGRKKWVLMFALILGAGGCFALGLAKQWTLFLVLFILAKSGYALGLIIYNSMLPDVAPEDRIDEISSKGYAWGYIGSCAPFLVCLLLVLGSSYIGLDTYIAMEIAFAIIAVWWAVCSVPLLRKYRQTHFLPAKKFSLENNVVRFARTFKEAFKGSAVRWFLLAFFFYIIGVYTIVNMAIAYGSSLGINSMEMLLALLTTQVVSCPCSIIIGRLTTKYSSSVMLTVCIIAYFGIAIFALFLQNIVQFWILAALVGMFQGGIQAISRSHFAKLIPAEKSGEYFGIMDVCGKGAEFLGSTTVGITTQLTGSSNIGVGALAVFFVVGLIVFRFSVKHKAQK